MGCPRCGGLDREPVAPGLWRCTTMLSRSLVAGLDSQGTPLLGQQTFACGTEYPEGAPPSPGAAMCEYCTTFAVGTCADCRVWVCGHHSAMNGADRVCARCSEVRTYAQLVSVADFLEAASAQGNPGMKTWTVVTTFEDPYLARSGGLRSRYQIEHRQGRDEYTVQGWLVPDQKGRMLGIDGREHALLANGASWSASSSVTSDSYMVFDFANWSTEHLSTLVRAIAARDGVDLTRLATRSPAEVRQAWADQRQGRERANAELVARAWSSWEAFVADGSFEQHAQDIVATTWRRPTLGREFREASVAGLAVRIGAIHTEHNFNRPGEGSTGHAQMCLTSDRRWVSLDARWMNPNSDRFRSELEVADAILRRLDDLGWTTP